MRLAFERHCGCIISCHTNMFLFVTALICHVTNITTKTHISNHLALIPVPLLRRQAHTCTNAHTHKGALKIITVEKLVKRGKHTHTYEIAHRVVVQARVLRVGFRAASVPSGRKHSAFAATCLEWTNHADCVGEKPSAAPKMKAEREASCKKTAVPSLFLLLWLFIFSLAGKTTS